MRIAIEAQRIFRPKKHGMDVVAIEIVKNLQQIDKANEYVLLARNGINDIFYEASNFQYKVFPSLTYIDWEQFHLLKQIKKVRPDLLHCTANTAPLLVNIPLIVTVHDIIYLEKINFSGTPYQDVGNLYRRFIVPKIAKKARIILTVSEFEKQNIIKKLGLPEEKVKVLYNGVGSQFNSNYSKEQVEQFRRTFGLPDQFIMFLGNTAPKKNTLNVIKAYLDYCYQAKEVIPLVLLDYKKEFVEKILHRLNQPDLLSRVIFPGYIPYSQIPLMYNAATLFLYPSLRESFGLPILEAMACGVPVITSNTSSMPEVAGDAAELINPYNHESLSQAIIRMLTDGELRNTYKERGLERVKRFTWRKSAEELLLLYETVA